MRILSITSLYPNNAQPAHGVFVENRIRHIKEIGDVSFRVVAPVPWFPFRSSRFGRYGAFARVVSAEERHGIAIDHPRYPVIPKIGMTIAPFLMHRRLRSFVAGLLDQGHRFDLIDAHYFYPDGVAAARLARQLDLPVTITARGVDINRIPDFHWPRRMILSAADQAAAIVTVSQSLKDEIARLGVDPGKVHALRNGVDLRLFDTKDPTALHDSWRLPSPIILSIGHLIPRKGHEFVIRSLVDLPQASLVIVGTGPDEKMLKGLVDTLGLQKRVKFLGAVPHGELANVYSACDVMVLASSSEGWANVLLESLACGTPVVATAKGGTPEVIRSDVAGRLIPHADPPLIAQRVGEVLAAKSSREQVRAYAEDFGWDETARRQLELYQRAIEAHRNV